MKQQLILSWSHLSRIEHLRFLVINRVLFLIQLSLPQTDRCNLSLEEPPPLKKPVLYSKKHEEIQLKQITFIASILSKYKNSEQSNTSNNESLKKR